VSEVPLYAIKNPDDHELNVRRCGQGHREREREEEERRERTGYDPLEQDLAHRS